MASPTTVVIDPQLLADAKRVLGANTTREAVNSALQQAVHRKRLSDAIDAIAQIELDLNPTKIDRD